MENDQVVVTYALAHLPGRTVNLCHKHAVCSGFGAPGRVEQAPHCGRCDRCAAIAGVDVAAYKRAEATDHLVDVLRNLRHLPDRKGAGQLQAPGAYMKEWARLETLKREAIAAGADVDRAYERAKFF